MMRFTEARGVSFPLSAFRVADPEVDESWYYEDWVDTAESQEVLRYQEHTFADYLQHVRQQAGVSRLLLKLVSPFIQKQIARDSPYYGKAPAVSSESNWALVCETFGLKPDQR